MSEETGQIKQQVKAFTYDTYYDYETPTEVVIAAVNTPVEFNIQTQSSSKRVVGMAISANTTDGTDNRAIAGCRFASPVIVQGVVVFPKKFRVRFLATGLEVSANDRFWNDINTPGDTANVTGSIECTDAGATYPFKLEIQLQETFKNDVRDR